MTELFESAQPFAFDGASNASMRAMQLRNALDHTKGRFEITPTSLKIGRAIEVDIIPRLVMAQRARDISDAAVAETRQQPHVFADLILGSDHAKAIDFIQTQREQGASLESLYISLLAPAARHLRDLWLDDLADLAEVTLGFWRLQHILREFSPAFCADGIAKSTGLRALLTTSPAETHQVGDILFSLALASEFFRRDGWDTWVEPRSTAADFTDIVRGQWFDVVEFFANSDKKLDDLASCIRLVRRESPNPAIGVLVYGPAFVNKPDLVLLVGGDAAVSETSQDSIQARQVVSLLGARR